MSNLKFPRRRLDLNGNWVVERPLVDPVVQRNNKIKICKEILTKTWPDGRPVYLAEVRAQAKQQLNELLSLIE